MILLLDRYEKGLPRPTTFDPIETLLLIQTDKIFMNEFGEKNLLDNHFSYNT